MREHFTAETPSAPRVSRKGHPEEPSDEGSAGWVRATGTEGVGAIRRSFVAPLLRMTPHNLRRRARRLGAGALLVLSVAARAQQPPPQPEGTKYGNYNVSQSVELGWRVEDRAGSAPMYNTLVDLHGGLRVLEQTLDVRSLNHRGLLFDTLSLTSFGYGGDPNAASRLRAQKNRWYNLNASFRRNRNFWDFDLLANPLNPPTSRPA